MCGIVGILDTRGRGEISRDLVARMNERQHHRGPDEGATHFEPGLGLGHRPLSIIDLATGQQPLFNEDGSVVVVFNGEIYNFRELIPELAARGHVFRTKSDTEVIVHAWEEWGEACVTRFRGMFAFALWERNRETNPAWLALNMMTEAKAGFRAFARGDRERREVDFVLLRRRLAEGATWGDELMREIAPWAAD